MHQHGALPPVVFEEVQRRLGAARKKAERRPAGYFDAGEGGGIHTAMQLKGSKHFIMVLQTILKIVLKPYFLNNKISGSPGANTYIHICTYINTYTVYIHKCVHIYIYLFYMCRFTPQSPLKS